MGYGRKTLSKNPKSGRWILNALKATDSTYLGGLTAPSLTSRPHMGPYNRVTPYKISDADDVYRQHDIGYGKEIAAGRSPYTRWNKYDQRLMDAPSTGWPDYVAKGVFGVKKFMTYGLPYTKNTRLKNVYKTSTTSTRPSPKYTVKYGSGLSGYVGQSGAAATYDAGGAQAQKWARKGQRTEVSTIRTPENSTQNASGGKSKLRVKTYISRS